MSWSNVFGLTVGLLVCVFVLVRIERKWLWLSLVFFILPLLLTIIGWTWLFGRWPETLIAGGLAAALGLAWWGLWGRRLGRASSESIRVWGQDIAPKPKAALQAEIDQLKEEKERLEVELKRLRDEKQTTDDGR
jgi:hypothetical protein